MSSTRLCDLRKNIFDRWILTHPHTTALAWSDNQWAEIDERGRGLIAQISHFATREEAEQYAIHVGLIVQKIELLANK